VGRPIVLPSGHIGWTLADGGSLGPGYRGRRGGPGGASKPVLLAVPPALQAGAAPSPASPPTAAVAAGASPSFSPARRRSPISPDLLPRTGAQDVARGISYAARGIDVEAWAPFAAAPYSKELQGRGGPAQSSRAESPRRLQLREVERWQAYTRRLVRAVASAAMHWALRAVLTAWSGECWRICAAQTIASMDEKHYEAFFLARCLDAWRWGSRILLTARLAGRLGEEEKEGGAEPSGPLARSGGLRGWYSKCADDNITWVLALTTRVAEAECRAAAAERRARRAEQRARDAERRLREAEDWDKAVARRWRQHWAGGIPWSPCLSAGSAPTSPRHSETPDSAARNGSSTGSSSPRSGDGGNVDAGSLPREEEKEDQADSSVPPPLPMIQVGDRRFVLPEPALALQRLGELWRPGAVMVVITTEHYGSPLFCPNGNTLQGLVHLTPSLDAELMPLFWQCADDDQSLAAGKAVPELLSYGATRHGSVASNDHSDDAFKTNSNGHNDNHMQTSRSTPRHSNNDNAGDSSSRTNGSSCINASKQRHSNNIMKDGDNSNFCSNISISSNTIGIPNSDHDDDGWSMTPVIVSMIPRLRSVLESVREEEGVEWDTRNCFL